VCKDLVEALPDPQKLETLADWLDLDDVNLRREGQDEVQQDLRVWAVRARAALANHKDCPEAQLMQLTADYLGEFLGAVERGVGAWKCYTAYVDGRYALIRVLSEQLFQEETENERLLAALEALMDCNRGSIPDEVWAKAREVVEAA